MRGFVLGLAMCMMAPVAWADARVTVLMDALRVPDLVAALRAEGLADAEALNADMLSGQGGAFWHEQVSRLYDAGPIEDAFYHALKGGMSDGALDVTLQFFDSFRGARITDLEAAARAAMMDGAVEDAAAEAFANLPGDDPAVQLVNRFIAVNDLLELNVALTMSTSYQFSRGLVDGGLVQMSEPEILNDVWASEDTVRASSERWLHGYFLLAQQPLDHADHAAYVEFAQSPAGRALNAALFAGYETVFADIAYGLGRAVAMNARGNDI